MASSGRSIDQVEVFDFARVHSPDSSSASSSPGSKSEKVTAHHKSQSWTTDISFGPRIPPASDQGGGCVVGPLRLSSVCGWEGVGRRYYTYIHSFPTNEGSGFFFVQLMAPFFLIS